MSKRDLAVGMTVAAFVAVALAGCTGPNPPPATTTRTTSPLASSAAATTSTTRAATALSATPTTGPVDTADIEQQVLAGYLRMQRAFAKASESANPSDPDLAATTTGPALQLLRKGLTSYRNDGLRARGQTIFHPKVIELSPAKRPVKAVVQDCMDTRKSVAYKANGTPYHDTPGGYRLTLAELQLVAGTWKVSGLGIHGVGSCKP